MPIMAKGHPSPHDHAWRDPKNPPDAIWWRSIFQVPDYYGQDPFMTGPTQADDLGLLFGVIKETRPRTLVEIGFFNGDGTRALLSAADGDSAVYSVDVKLNFWKARPAINRAVRAARSQGIRVANWTLVIKNATEIASADVDERPVDFVFFDGPHLLAINQRIFRRLLPMLSSHAIVAVHDTGYWSSEWLQRTAEGRRYAADACKPSVGCVRKRGSTTGKLMLLHPNSIEERKFISWVLRNGSGVPFHAVSLHSFDYVRNGITLLQRKHYDHRENDWRRRSRKR